VSRLRLFLTKIFTYLPQEQGLLDCPIVGSKEVEYISKSFAKEIHDFDYFPAQE